MTTTGEQCKQYGRCIHREGQAAVSEEGAAPNYTTGTKGASGTQYLAWR